MAQTLMAMAGLDLTPGRLSAATLVLIDMQGEYERALALPNASPATTQAAILLERARAVGTPVIHIQHAGEAGGLFDLTGPGGAFLSDVTPRDGESIIQKHLPSGFAGTDLADALKKAGRKELIFCGFMTHMCVSTTVRAALDFGYRSTVVDAACATRDLPDGTGGIISAADLHRATLAALSDRFAVIAPDADAILD